MIHNPNSNRGGNPFGSTNMIVGMIVLALGLVALYFVASGIFWLLSKIAILLFVAAAVMDFSVISDYIKFVFGLFKKNIFMGLVATVLTVVGYPVVAALLFGKVMLKRQMNKVMGELESEKKEEFVEYEEVDDEENDDFLELPEIEKPIRKRDSSNDYEDLFD